MRVRLDVYDLAGGGLRWLPSLLAPHHNIWPHVVLSVYGREYTYNGEDGVREMPRRERRAPESHPADGTEASIGQVARVGGLGHDAAWGDTENV